MRLSTHQSQVLALLRQGLTNKGIAQQLGISENTARDHVSALLKRSQCSTRTALIVQWVQRDDRAQPKPSTTSTDRRAPIDRRQATGDSRQATGD